MKSKKNLKKVRTKKVNKSGLAPGSIIFTGDQKVEHTNVHLVKYNDLNLETSTLDVQKEITFKEAEEGSVTWYDIRGLHDIKLIESIGQKYKIHPLVLEGVVDTIQRPKFEEYDNGVFILCKALSFDSINSKIKTEQVSIFLSKNILISFQEDEDDLFAGVRERINVGRGKVRKKGADYLGYALLDNIVDNYFLVLDKIEEEIEKLEVEITNSADSQTKTKNHQLKREMLTLRKAVQPLREAINKFAKSDSPFVEESTEIFLRDLYDHTIQVMDMVETYRDVLTGLQDLYLSEISFKMNQIMQVLTVISTIFIPLSFLTGMYGMNFENMPELKTQYGYFVLLAVMGTLVVSLLVYFKRNKWV